MNREHYFCHEVIRNQTHILSADSLILKECCICKTDKKKTIIFSLTFQCFHFLFLNMKMDMEEEIWKSFLGRSALSLHLLCSLKWSVWIMQCKHLHSWAMLCGLRKKYYGIWSYKLKGILMLLLLRFLHVNFSVSRIRISEFNHYFFPVIY